MFASKVGSCGEPAVCLIPFYKRAERGRHTPHNNEGLHTVSKGLRSGGKRGRRVDQNRGHVNGRVELTHVRGAG